MTTLLASTRMPGLTLAPAVRTHVGLVREHNEDAVLASPRLLAVADGVGGSVAGEVASLTVIMALAHMDKCRLTSPLPNALGDAVLQGNERIRFIAECRPQMKGMSTTVTAVALGDTYAIANIGDSRAYLLRDGKLRRLTRDDTYVQALVDSGGLDPELARRHPQRSAVLAALDGDPARSPTVTTYPPRAGDRLLLCSDGLTDVVDDETLRAALGIPSRDRCVERLLELALAAGGPDNISAIVADVVSDGRS